jgi:hypothetical protein
MIARVGTMMRSPAAGAASAAPAIPASGNVLWLMSDDGVFTDTGRTTPATGSQQVKGWEDFSGAGNHASIRGSTGPTLSTTLGPVGLSFSSSEEFILENLLTLTECEGFIVYRNSQTVGLQVLLGHSIPGSYIAHDAGNNAYYAYPVLAANGTPTGLASTPAVDQTFYLYGWALTATTNEGYLNDGSVTSVVANNCHYKFDRIGFYNNTAINNPNGHMFEVIVYDRKLTAPERAQVQAYLNAKYTLY